MPNYRFQCNKCQHAYYELASWDESGKYPDVQCPKCESFDKTQLVTACAAIVFTDPRGTSKGDSFSYVAGYNMAQAKEERRKAEEVSKGGVECPYNPIDDVSSGMYEGEIQ